MDWSPTSTQQEDILTIARSTLFDEAWYRKNCPDLARGHFDPIAHYVLVGAAEGRMPSPGFRPDVYRANIGAETVGQANPLAHYIRHGRRGDLIERGALKFYSSEGLELAFDRLARLPIFSVEEYRLLNRDLEGALGKNSFRYTNHALAYGFSEGRHVFSKLSIARVLGEISRQPFPPAAGAPRKGGIGKLPRIGVLYNSAGNTFLKELAQDIVDSLTLAGQRAALVDETTNPDDRPPLAIVMAPHEFFHLGGGRRWLRDDIIRGSFVFNTEQPQTIWYERGMPFILGARGVIDISYQAAEIFKQCGMPAMHFNPTPAAVGEQLSPEEKEHALFRILCPAAQATPDAIIPFAERTIDVSFFGTSSDHRDGFFSRHARRLAEYKTYLYYRRFTGPLKAGPRDGFLSRLAAHVAAHSKISLNIHRDSFGFFEWHRMV
jgi:hypothetical protein